jgi:ABC-type polysaccharide/polyol phosphate export permease
MPLSAADDLSASLRHWRIWTNLAFRDIRGRYRRTVIGPFWTVLNSAVLIVSLGLVYALLWRISVREMLPYFCAGYLVWTLFTIVVSESAVAFISADPIIKSLNLPYLMHVFRVIWRNLIVFAHSLVVYVVLMAYLRIWPGAALWLLVPALLLVTLNVLWIGVIVAVACTRFRDLIQVVTSLLQVLFLVTPIVWPVTLLDGQGSARMARILLSDANFAYHLVDVVRAPLIGAAPSALTWTVLTVTAVAGNLAALAVFSRWRSQIAFWL